MSILIRNKNLSLLLEGTDANSQFKWISQLYAISPTIDGKPFRVAKRDKTGKPIIQEISKNVTIHYFPVSDVDLPHSVAVFEFDGDDKEKNYENSAKIETFLKDNKLNYFKHEYSGRSPHLWVFLKVSKNLIKSTDYFRIREIFAKWILLETNTDIKKTGFDMGNITAKRHLIRAPTGKIPEKIEFAKLSDAKLKSIFSEVRDAKKPEKPKKPTGERGANILEELINDNSKPGKTVNMSGLLPGNVFYHTIFISNGAGFKTCIITSDGEAYEVFNKKEEILNENPREKVPPYYDYDYFTFKGDEFRFPEKLFFTDKYKITMISRNCLKLIKNKATGKEIYEKLTGKIKEFYDHYEPNEYPVISAFVISSYILHLLGVAFYYILTGKHSTGKTTLQKLISKLQFMGKFAGKSSVAVMVRQTHFLGSNQNLDEFSKLGKDEQTEFYSWANSGFSEGGTRETVNMNKQELREQIQIYNTFSLKSFSANHLNFFPEDFLSRCYVNISIQSNRRTRDINNLTEEDGRDFQEIVDGLFAYCLQNYQGIIDDINSVKEELEAAGVYGRKNEIHRTILGITRHFNPKNYLSLKNFLNSRDEIEQKQEGEQGIDFLILKCFTASIGANPVVEFSNGELLNYLYSEMNITENSKYKPNARTIGRAVRRIGLIRNAGDVRRGTKTGGMVYIINKENLKDVLIRENYTDLLKHIETSVETSVTSVKEKNPEKKINMLEGDKTVSEVTEVSEHKYKGGVDKIYTIEKIVKSLCEQNKTERLADYSDIVEYAAERKILEPETRDLLNHMTNKGILFEPLSDNRFKLA
ncbi:hypothetical protein BEH94_03520 [Candidatus Altiarchaeales archaeon WOR_SM1_SCG]|nr:hypothetical protein BEH94_03520 [Candidatus Altiarchaeales archaeon WOR_SM1_SCG]